MPWVLKKYYGEKIDLNNREYFRDLTKPMGACVTKNYFLFIIILFYFRDHLIDHYFFIKNFITQSYIVNFIHLRIRRSRFHHFIMAATTQTLVLSCILWLDYNHLVEQHVNYNQVDGI